MMPTAVDVMAARRRIRGWVDVTPLHQSAWLSSLSRQFVTLKLENVQRSGSFKIRGAFNALARLERGSEVVTASAGNHGRAVALAAETLGLQATVFAPTDAPKAKLAAIERHGANLHRVATYDEAEEAARAFAHDRGRPFISPYNHPDVIAAAGTIALEIFDVAPDIAAIVVPVGGGGLIAGTAIAAKAIAPGIRIIGVEAEASTAFTTSLRNGRITVIEPRPTLADGLAGNLEPNSITFEIVQRLVDDVVTVSEEELAAGMRGLAGEEHLIAEGAGAAAVAAISAGKVRVDGKTVAVVSGANIDLDRLMGVLRGG
jgi:threonine dehydratase